MVLCQHQFFKACFLIENKSKYLILYFSGFHVEKPYTEISKCLLAQAAAKETKDKRNENRNRDHKREKEKVLLKDRREIRKRFKCKCDIVT